MDDYLVSVYRYVTEWGFIFVFVVLFLECIPFVGFAVPGLTVLLFSGYLAAQLNPVQAIELFLAGLGGVFLADNIAFWFGKKIGLRSKWVRALLRRNEKRIDYLSSQSDWMLFLYQFPPYLRMIAPLVLGVLNFTQSRWLRIVAASSILFVAVFFGIGYSCGQLQQHLSASIELAKETSIVLAIILTIWVGSLIVRTIRMK